MALLPGPRTGFGVGAPSSRLSGRSQPLQQLWNTSQQQPHVQIGVPALSPQASHGPAPRGQGRRPAPFVASPTLHNLAFLLPEVVHHAQLLRQAVPDNSPDPMTPALPKRPAPKQPQTDVQSAGGIPVAPSTSKPLPVHANRQPRKSPAVSRGAARLSTNAVALASAAASVTSAIHSAHSTLVAAADSSLQSPPQAALSAPAPAAPAVAPAASASAAAAASSAYNSLPEPLLALQDAGASKVALPPFVSIDRSTLDNWKLDKLVAALGRSRTTWRRALQLYEWLKEGGHALDERLCTTLIRVCADHGDADSALAVYDWMRGPRTGGDAAKGAQADAGTNNSGGTGGAGVSALRPTAYTYTATMRAALGAGMLERALQIWDDVHAAGVAPDSRLCITYMEVCMRQGLTDKAMAVYAQMRDAPAASPMAPTVHAYTCAMRAATDGGRWTAALSVWDDMKRAGCAPTGHAYAAAITACAAGADWRRAVSLFEEMAGPAGIRPDVVTCTALVSALASAGKGVQAEEVVAWMLASGLKPNVRTYTALITALGNAKDWLRAIEMLLLMQTSEWGAVAPNAFTYSALLKSLADHAQWQLAEAVFGYVEHQVQQQQAAGAPADREVPAAAAALPPLLLRDDGSTAASAAGASGGSLLAGSGGADEDAAAAGAAPGAAGDAAAAGASVARSNSGSWSSPAQLNGLNLDLGLFQPQQADRLTGSSAGTLFASDSLPLLAATPSAAAAAGAAAGAAAAAADLGSAPLLLSDAAGVVPGAWPFPNAPASMQQHQQHQHQQAPWLQHRSAATIAAAAAAAAAATGSTVDMAAVVAAAASAWVASFSTAAGSAAPAAAPAPAAQQQSGPKPHAKGQEQNGGASGNHPANAPLVNAVVCGSLMSAYERAGKWQEAVGVLDRARGLGVAPNTIMYNIAISAAGKAGQLELAQQLLGSCPHPDLITHETLISAYSVAGRPQEVEALISSMRSRGLPIRDYSYCNLIAAYSMVGDVDSALAVRDRILAALAQARTAAAPRRPRVGVHVYNALLAACERGGRYVEAAALWHDMEREGVEGNSMTEHLLSGLIAHQELILELQQQQQQAAEAALGAVVAAAGAETPRSALPASAAAAAAVPAPLQPQEEEQRQLVTAA